MIEGSSGFDLVLSVFSFHRTAACHGSQRRHSPSPSLVCTSSDGVTDPKSSGFIYKMAIFQVYLMKNAAHPLSTPIFLPQLNSPLLFDKPAKRAF